jgi:hypothetical protein
MNHQIPDVIFEEMNPLDARSAVAATSAPRSRKSVYLYMEGFHFQTFMDWAIQDASDAHGITTEAAKERFLVGALMNSRRALSCLVDYYLRRDGFAFCGDAPKSAPDKSNLLIRRGIFDQLAADTLSRAVDRRNKVEHRYEIPNVADVEDTVQLVRATIETAVRRSDPMWAPGVYNYFLGGNQTSDEETTFWFDGWSGVMFVMAVTESPPWFGIVLPSSTTQAQVRWTLLEKFTCDQLFEIHTHLEVNRIAGFSGYGPQMFRGQLNAAGLILRI